MGGFFYSDFLKEKNPKTSKFFDSEIFKKSGNDTCPTRVASCSPPLLPSNWSC
jgi:hypothetical protein